MNTVRLTYGMVKISVDFGLNTIRVSVFCNCRDCVRSSNQNRAISERAVQKKCGDQISDHVGYIQRSPHEGESQTAFSVYLQPR